MDTLKVRDARDVEQVVRAAIASEQPLEIVGHGSKRLIGQPMATNALLDLSDLNAVTAYEPNELIITAQAGAPLADVLSLIDSKNQQFAFEPMNTGPLLGTPDLGTIGGMIGAGLAGPRRIKAGGARDHLLGAHAVSGFGDSFVAGGKVVKNVTGYDLCKLLAGSWGTLAVMTEVTLKVMPRPGQADPDHAADGPERGRAEQACRVHRLERELLVLGIDQRQHVGNGRARLHGDDQFVRLIRADRVQIGQIEQRIGRHRLADQPL